MKYLTAVALLLAILLCVAVDGYLARSLAGVVGDRAVAECMVRWDASADTCRTLTRQ